MQDIEGLLHPATVIDPKPAAIVPSIHPSRVNNFNTTALAAEDTSFRPGANDIAHELQRKLDPAESTKKKSSLDEKRTKGKKKLEQRNISPKPFVPPVLVATGDAIDNALGYFLQGLTGEAQALSTLVTKLKSDVKAGGRVVNVRKEVFARLGLRREGVNEDGSGGRIVVEVLENRGKSGGTSEEEEDD
jgi:hypothetical protein